MRPLPNHYQPNIEFNFNKTRGTEGTADHVTLLGLLLSYSRFFAHCGRHPKLEEAAEEEAEEEAVEEEEEEEEEGEKKEVMGEAGAEEDE